MSAVPVRSYGHHPETQIRCDFPGGACASNERPPSDWSAEDARRVARIHGWTRDGAKDYCSTHTEPEEKK
jgi:hypothetical protein